MQRKGFTLVELLVVIAIVTILAAILFPVYSRAREMARRSSCLSNVRQLSSAILSYSQDYDECLPASYKDGAACRYWMEAIYPYCSSTQVFMCPSLGNDLSAWNTAYTSYGFNYQYLTLKGWTTPYDTLTASLGEIAQPSETIMLADGFGPKSLPDGYGAGRGSGIKLGYVISPSGVYFPALRHNGLATTGFVDGHVKVSTMAYLSNLANWDLK